MIVNVALGISRGTTISSGANWCLVSTAWFECFEGKISVGSELSDLEGCMGLVIFALSRVLYEACYLLVVFNRSTLKY